MQHSSPELNSYVIAAVPEAEVPSDLTRSATIAALVAGLISTVEVGSKLVDSAGATMAEIVGSVQRVTGLMSEFAAAGNEQRQGIGQVNQSMAEMDDATQQNAALVEEAAAAAASLQPQSAKLAQVLSVFKLQGGVAPAATAATTARSPAPDAGRGQAGRR